MKKTAIVQMIFIFSLLFISCKKNLNKNDSKINLDDYEFKWIWGIDTHYESDEMDGYQITKYKGEEIIVKIPAYYNEKPIRYIGNNAFVNNVTKKLILPKTLIYHFNRAFFGLSELEEIELDGEKNEYFLSRDGILYNYANEMWGLYFVPPKRSKDLVIESDIEEIDFFAFTFAINIENVIIKADSKMKKIGFLFWHYNKEKYKLKNIYVDPTQYEYFIELFDMNKLWAHPLLKKAN